jgi:hypothetical protein
MIDRGIEIQFLFQIGALFGSTGNPNCARSVDFGKLPDERTDGSAGRRDHNRFASLWLTDCFQSGVGREARHAQNPQPRGYWKRASIDPAYPCARRNGVRSPSGAGEHYVSLREVGMV